MKNKTNFFDMIGCKIESVKVDKNKETTTFCFEDEKRVARFYHEQDCCEEVYIYQTNIDESCHGKTIVSIVELIGDEYATKNEQQTVIHDKEKHKTVPYECETWTRYEIELDDGSKMFMLWHGVSNGYYSESVNFNWI